MTTKTKLPKALRNSDAYMDNPTEAQALWDEGYRPMKAEELKPGYIAAYRVTDIFQLNPVGPVRYSRVLHVKHEDWAVLIEHTGGEAEEDEGAEVWAKDPYDCADDRHEIDDWPYKCKRCGVHCCEICGSGKHATSKGHDLDNPRYWGV